MTPRTRSLSRTLVAATAAAAPVVVLAPSAQAAPTPALPRSPLPTTPLPTTPAPATPVPATPLPTVETSTVTRWVSVSVANVRSGPSTSYRVTGTKTSGTQVRGTVTSNGWVKLSSNEYMSPTVLTSTDPGGSASSGTVTQYVTAEIGRVRSGPSLNHSVVGTRTYGTKVTGTWVNGWLNMGNGQYMGGSILSSTNPAGGGTTTPPSSGTRVDRWVNVPVANVRSGPGLNYRVVGTETSGTKLSGTTANGWVNLGNGRYISETVVTATNPGSSTPAPPSSGTTVERWVSVPVANVRSGPSLSHRVVGTATSGTRVSGTLSNGWINMGNGRYISETVVTATDPGSSTPAPPSDGGTTQVRRYVNVPVANVRSGPSTSYGVVGTRTHGTEVRGVLTSNGWLKISDREFMSPGVLSTTDPGSRDGGERPAPTPGISPLRQAILDEAARHVGKPYVLYSEPDATFDCSSYTWWVYKQNGVNIPRTVRDQKAFVTRVTDPQPGDLIFYDDFYHVGIYSGPGTTYEALNPTAGVRHGPLISSRIWYGRVPGL